MILPREPVPGESETDDVLLDGGLVVSDPEGEIVEGRLRGRGEGDGIRYPGAAGPADGVGEGHVFVEGVQGGGGWREGAHYAAVGLAPF